MMTSMSDELVELAVAYICETGAAMKFEDGAAEFWVPKSLLYWEDGTPHGHGDIMEDIETICVPEWWAHKEGLT